MKRRFLVSVLWLVVTPVAAATDPAVHPMQALEEARRAMFDQLADSVVFVHCGGQFGSGFFVDATGLILTNRHVVDCKGKLEVVLHDGYRADAERDTADPVYDLALLRIRPPKPVKPLDLADSDQAKIGDYAACVSHPVGGVWTFNDGFISNRYPSSDDQMAGMVQTQIPLLPGSSGGPVVNRLGKVVCIHTAGLKSGATMGFCIESNLARRLMSQHSSANSAQLAVDGDVEGVVVMVDGRKIGGLPVLANVGSGPHRLEVRQGTRVLRKEVMVKEGKTTTVFVKGSDLKNEGR